MMKISNHLYLLFCFILMGWMALSCDDGEPEINGLEPFFKVKLINQDSLDTLNAQINEIDTRIAAIDGRIKEINDSIANGDSTDYTQELVELNDEKKVLNNDKTGLSKTVSVILSGKVGVTKIEAENGLEPLLYEDSLTFYRLPLNSNANFSKYYFFLADTMYMLNASYQRQTIVKERKVQVEALQFNIIDYSFDTVIVHQTDSINFTSNEATVNLYF